MFADLIVIDSSWESAELLGINATPKTPFDPHYTKHTPWVHIIFCCKYQMLLEFVLSFSNVLSETTQIVWITCNSVKQSCLCWLSFPRSWPYWLQRETTEAPVLTSKDSQAMAPPRSMQRISRVATGAVFVHCLGQQPSSEMSVSTIASLTHIQNFVSEALVLTIASSVLVLCSHCMKQWGLQYKTMEVPGDANICETTQ